MGQVGQARHAISTALYNTDLIFQYNTEVHHSQHIAGSILQGPAIRNIYPAAIAVVYIRWATKECGVDHLTTSNQSLFAFI